MKYSIRSVLSLCFLLVEVCGVQGVPAPQSLQVDDPMMATRKPHPVARSPQSLQVDDPMMATRKPHAVARSPQSLQVDDPMMATRKPHAVAQRSPQSLQVDDPMMATRKPHPVARSPQSLEVDDPMMATRTRPRIAQRTNGPPDTLESLGLDVDLDVDVIAKVGNKNPIGRDIDANAMVGAGRSPIARSTATSRVTPSSSLQSHISIPTAPMVESIPTSTSMASSPMSTFTPEPSDGTVLTCLRNFSGCLQAHGEFSIKSCETEALMCLDKIIAAY